MAEAGLCLDGSEDWHEATVAELAYAMRPIVHERRIPSFGAIVAPTTDPGGWRHETELTIIRRSIGDRPTVSARRYADGVSSWLIRHVGGGDEWAVFDRPAGSERDLVVLSEVLGATLVQRHPAGPVRVVGSFGVFRWDGIDWHHEPLVSTWIDSVSACGNHGDREVLEILLEFAVHDLGSRGIGSTLVYQPDQHLEASFDRSMPVPPPLGLTRPADLAPLRHVLAQVDGASLFSTDGTLLEIGVRLVPSVEAEADVDGYRGTRHTSGRRYSFDDPGATVVVVSEDGPVTAMRAGQLLGASTPDAGSLLT
ncbi:hypothetical protein BH23ACT2_BH23ACT2_06020 [soil metagenome]